MYETWTSAKSDIDLTGYTSHNFYRKFQHRNAKRSSGGIVLYYKNSIKDGVSVIMNHFDTIIWVKLDKEFFKLDSDMYICGAYLWGENSPAYNAVNVDLFDIIESDISYYKTLGNVYVNGDFNARVGSKNDYIVFDRNNEAIDDPDYTPDPPLQRTSLDRACNSHGGKLIDLCKSTCLRIVNGRLGSDHNKGDYTFVSKYGASVIDYVLTSEQQFSSIVSFSIESVNEWSDHAPLCYALQCNIHKQTTDSQGGIKYTWSDDCKTTFRSGLIAQLPVLNDLTRDIELNNRSTIDTLVNDFTTIIRKVADPLFEKNVKCNSSSYFTDVSVGKNAEWFDNDCRHYRNVYLESLRIFNRYKSPGNREILCDNKKKYKDLCRKKKRIFENRKFIQIENLRKGKPKDFWKFFKKKSSHTVSSVSLEQFYEYFSTLGDDIYQVENEEAEMFCNTHNFDDADCCFEELDCPISCQEVLQAVKRLKAGKSPGRDCLLNEYFIESCDILVSHLCDIFNAILSSGYFPDTWMDGVLIPVFKKGDVSSARNYRGITLVSCMSKLFTTILNKRIEMFCAENDKISDAQFGFKKGHSTVDAMFILLSTIQKHLIEKQRLYVCFVDLKRCFDSINRNALWYKLYNTGIQGRLLRVIRDMYSKVKSCVKQCDSYSEYFEYAVGLRQGEVISPILVSLFMEDLELYLQQDVNSGLLIDDIVLILLLFADDMALIGRSVEELQESLSLLHTYCNTWGLEVNTEKTKIVVFRNRGQVRNDEVWTYNGEIIDVVDDFNYLGTIFNYTGSFTKNQDHLVGKSLKALNTLLHNCNKIKLKPKLLCQLFDSFVGSILGYSSELWGFNKCKELERIHLKFLKRILSVKRNTSSMSVYGELGRYPLYISRYVRIIKYWFKVANSDNIIVQKVYNESVIVCEKGYRNWAASVKNLLNIYGLGYAFNIPHQLNAKVFPVIFKQRVIDTFLQQWHVSINSSAMLNFYKCFKHNFEYETYLDILPHSLRCILSKIRLSCLPLRIQTGRYAPNRIERNERLCLYCNSGDIEDEYHFICVCSKFAELRKLYIKKYYFARPSMFKFIQLLNSSNKNLIRNLCIFVRESLKLRNSLTVAVQ